MQALSLRTLPCTFLSISTVLYTFCAFADTSAISSLELKTPLVVHGLKEKEEAKKVPGLPDGDIHEYPSLSAPSSAKGITFTLSGNGVGGAEVFPLDDRDITTGEYLFGASETEISGLLRKLDAQAISVSSPSAAVTGLTCTDMFWDLNFALGKLGAVDGDQVSFFVQTADGTITYQLVSLRLEGNDAVVNSIHPATSLYIDNRLAVGNALSTGTHLEFSQNGGTRGLRTELFTLSFMGPQMAPWKDLCMQLGVKVERASGQGMVTVAVTDIVTKRSEKTKNDNGAGLIAGVDDFHPTGLVCGLQNACPLLQGEVFECRNICFKSPEYYSLYKGEIPTSGTVYVTVSGQVRAVSPTSNAVLSYLRGSFRDPLSLLNQQFVAAQISTLLAGGSKAGQVIGALNSPLTCSRLFERSGLSGEGVTEIALSDGTVIRPESKLDVVFAEARRLLAVGEQSTADRVMITRLLGALYNRDIISSCTNPAQFPNLAVAYPAGEGPAIGRGRDRGRTVAKAKAKKVNKQRKKRNSRR